MFIESLSGAHASEATECGQGESKGCEVNEANTRTYGLMANTAAVALAAIEQCQAPILELHEYVERAEFSVSASIDFAYEYGYFDRHFELVRETPGSIFDDEGNLEEEALRKLEKQCMLAYGGNDTAEWIVTDGLHWDATNGMHWIAAA